jgi:hypothetical protein
MKTILKLLLLASIAATAQVKIGSNPTTIAANANLQVEGTAATNQFTVLKNGNVGIGTTAPAFNLDLYSQSNLGTTAGSFTSLSRFSGSDGNFSQLTTQLRRHTAGTFWDQANIRIQRVVDTTPQSFIDFGISGKISNYGLGFGTGNTTNMVLESDGNVGIGESSPAAKLSFGSSHNNGKNQFTDPVFGVRNDVLSIYNNGTSHYGFGIHGGCLETYVPDGSNLVFGHRSPAGNIASRFIITSGGTVGVGTISPTGKLQVDNPIGSFVVDNNAISQARFVSGNYGTMIRNDGSDTYFLLTASGDSFGGWSALRPITINNATGNVHLTLGAGGRVGIGMPAPNSVPTSKLQVVGLPTHANNAAAILAGLSAGAFYHAGDGILRVVY